MPDPAVEELAARVRSLLEDEAGLTERAMFGGRAFLLSGNIAVAVRPGGGLLVRTGPEAAEAASAEPHAAVARMGERVMRGWVQVEPAGLGSEQALSRWVARGVASARALAPK